MDTLKTAARLFRVPVLGPMVQRTYWMVRAGVLHFGAKPLMRRYVRRPGPHRLHLGAGGEGLPGWLNTDLHPERWPTVRLDATRPFPLPDAAFDCVFSEHMIEHLPLAGARQMLREAFRVLQPGGRIRIATPDLARVVGLYSGTPAGSTAEYLQWAVAYGRHPTELPADAVVINSLFHDHGHQFLFDEATLGAALRQAGFTDIRRWPPGESNDEHLRSLEVHHCVIGRMANNFETLVLEARKP